MGLSRSLLAVQLACATVLSTNHPVSAVVDGQPVRARASQDRAHELERTVRLVQKTGPASYDYLCTGFVADDATVFTGASCLLPDLYKEPLSHSLFVELYPGTPFMRRTPFQPLYVRADQNADFAIGRLLAPPVLTSSIPVANGSCDADSPLQTVGFGMDENARLPAKPRLSNFAGAGQTDLNRGKICIGDAGGPVFCKSHGKIAFFGIANGITFSRKPDIKPGTSQPDICRMADNSSVSILMERGLAAPPERPTPKAPGIPISYPAP